MTIVIKIISNKINWNTHYRILSHCSIQSVTLIFNNASIYFTKKNGSLWRKTKQQQEIASKYPQQ